MKKTMKLTSLLLILLSTLLLLSSCADLKTAFFAEYPHTDPQRAKEELEKNDYTVLYLDGDLKNAELGDLAGAELEEGMTAFIYAVHYPDDGYVSDEYIMITWYESKALAREEYEKQLAEMEESGWDSEKEQHGVFGKMVWFASSLDAIKAAR